jgi:hypothetical protein
MLDRNLRVARLEAVSAQSLHPAWQTILPGLKRVQRRNASHWICEDVYAAIRNNQSSLHLAKLDDYYAGFVVLTPIQAWDGLNLHIWCAYATGGYDPMDAFLPEIDRLAHECKARRITFWSSRGWARDGRILEHGFKVNQTEFVKEI